jgi:hypothetical protein
VVASRDTGEREYSKRLKGEARRDVSSSPPPLPPSSPSSSSSQSTGSVTAIGAGARSKAVQEKREPWAEKEYFK